MTFRKKSCIKCEKSAFYELFAHRSANSVRKECFFFKVFCDILYEVRTKRKKSIFELFQRCSADNVGEQCFFHIVSNTSYEVPIKYMRAAFFELLERIS